MGEGPGSKTWRRQQGSEVYEQQDPLQSYRSRCPYQRKARQGKKAELPEPVERGYRPSCNYRYQGVPCRWQGQPAVTGYRTVPTEKIMAAGPRL